MLVEAQGWLDLRNLEVPREQAQDTFSKNVSSVFAYLFFNPKFILYSSLIEWRDVHQKTMAATASGSMFRLPFVELGPMLSEREVRNWLPWDNAEA